MSETLELAPITSARTAAAVDVQKITVQVRSDPAQYLTYDLHWIRRVDQLPMLIQWLEVQKRIGIDTETSGIDVFDHHLATIQVGNPFADVPIAFVIDYRLFTAEELKPVLDLIASKKRIKLGQNVKFEYKYLKHRANCDLHNLQDTQIAEMIIRAGLFPESSGGDDYGEGSGKAYSHTSMAALCERYLGIKIDKDLDLRTSFYTTPPGTYSLRQLVYAALDVIYPFYIWEDQAQEIETRALKSTIAIEMRSIRVTALAELRGMRLDTTKWRELYQEAVQKRADADQKLHALLMSRQQREVFSRASEKVLYPKSEAPVNFDSGEQIKWAIKSYCESINWPYQLVTTKKALNVLRRRFGAEWLQKRYENQRGARLPLHEFMGKMVEKVPDYLIPESQYCILVKTDKDTLRLARVKKQLPAEIVGLLLEYGTYSIRADTFGNDFIRKYVREDGKVHTEFHQAKTSTGRYTCTPNLQNIPLFVYTAEGIRVDQRYRESFGPSSGYKYVIADYSQQEPRLTAQECQDPVYLGTYIRDEDIYLNVCEPMLGYRPDVNSPDPEFAAKSKRDRQLMKTIVLAMAYRMGAYKLHRKLILAFEQDILEGRMELPTYEYVKGLHEKFLTTFSKLVEYQEHCSNNASHTLTTRQKLWDRYLNEPITWATARCGRKRFFGPDYEGVYTAAANSPIQGSAATMTKVAAVLIQDHIDQHGIDAGLVDIVHDELVYECREEQAPEFAKIVQHLMEKAGKFYLPDVPIKAEFPKNTNGVLDYWAKEVKAA